MTTAVTAIPPADPQVALARFSAKFALETDCWDVYEALKHTPDFVLLDVRSPTLFADGHVHGAVNLPHGKITHERLGAYPLQTMFVAYCAGPHCNGADRAAVRIASLGRFVKIMIGGVAGWKDEGFALSTAETTT